MASIALNVAFLLPARGAGVPEGRPPKPWTTIALEPLGFFGVPRPFLEAGSSMLSVHFVDSEHVLLTYSLRSLVPRRAQTEAEGEAQSDDGRLVGAYLIAVPSGKVVAHTVWHTADHGQYLWNLGRGRFLLRLGRELSVIAPLARLDKKDPFEAARFPEREGMPAAVFLSPDGELLTVETLTHERKRRRMVLAPTADDHEEEKKSREVVVDFYRLSGDGSDSVPLHLSAAGAIRAPEPISLPIDGDGYLWIGENRRGQWPVAFHEFGGKAEDITPVLSSCVPRLQMLSRSQFLAFACQGSEDRVKLMAYGFDGHENWEESLAASLAPATFSFAPEAGRFAMSRLMSGYVANSEIQVSTSSNWLQEIRVYQTESGDLLLRVQASPALKVQQNFDLSADGRFLAVVRGARLEIYELPKVSGRDLKDLADARQFEPPHGSGPVRLGLFTRQAAPEEEATKPSAEPANANSSADTGGSAATAAAHAAPAPDAGPAATPAAADRVPAAASGGSSPATAAQPTTAGDPSGDAAPGERRKPPTLLNPGEKSEGGKPR